MGANILTIDSRIQCPHGGTALLFTKNVKTSARVFALLESDVHVVIGCPFTIGTKYSPCVTIEWSKGASKVTVNGTAVLVKSSIGKCKSGEGAVQGVASINQTQQKASAT